MKIQLKNDPRIDSGEGDVDEFHEIKDEIFPEGIDISELPMCLGKDVAERIKTGCEFRRSGMYIYDSKQD